MLRRRIETKDIQTRRKKEAWGKSPSNAAPISLTETRTWDKSRALDGARTGRSSAAIISMAEQHSET